MNNLIFVLNPFLFRNRDRDSNRNRDNIGVATFPYNYELCASTAFIK